VRELIELIGECIEYDFPEKDLVAEKTVADTPSAT